MDFAAVFHRYSSLRVVLFYTLGVEVKGSRHFLWCGGQGVKTLFMVWSRGQDTFYGVEVKGSRHFLWCGQGVKTLFMVWSRGQDTFYGVVNRSRGKFSGQKS